MWRFGYLTWRAWVYARVLVPAGLVLWVVYRARGNSLAFWITTVFIVGMLAGARFVLRDLARRELGTPIVTGRRSR